MSESKNHLVRLLEAAEKNPDALFHVEVTIRGSSTCLVVNIDGDDLATLTTAFNVGVDHPVNLTDYSGSNGPRAVMVDPMEIAFLRAMDHIPKRGRQG